MSLEYYIFCKEQYEGIILRLENIIENYNFNIDATNSEENIDKNNFELFQTEENHIFLTNKLTHIKELKSFCDKNIKNLCVHNFEHDLIDINPEKSINITYCNFCGYTK